MGPAGPCCCQGHTRNHEADSKVPGPSFIPATKRPCTECLLARSHRDGKPGPRTSVPSDGSHFSRAGTPARLAGTVTGAPGRMRACGRGGCEPQHPRTNRAKEGSTTDMGERPRLCGVLSADVRFFPGSPSLSFSKCSPTPGCEVINGARSRG